jgi:hypothetical protein
VTAEQGDAPFEGMSPARRQAWIWAGRSIGSACSHHCVAAMMGPDGLRSLADSSRESVMPPYADRAKAKVSARQAIHEPASRLVLVLRFEEDICRALT